MNPWPPEGEPEGKGTKPVTLPRPGHADLAGVQKYGLADVRDALERASARHTAVHVAAGAVAKALLAEIGIEVAGAALPEAGADPAAVDAARTDRDTLGGVVEVRALGVPPGLGSYARKEDRLDARLAAALMGIQAVKGVEVGDGFALARLRGSEAHDEIVRDDGGLHRETNRAGGIEGGMSNGEEIVVRAAMKPLPTLMKPLALGRPRHGRARAGARRAERRLGGRGARRRRGGGGRVGARARGAREVRRRRARRLRGRVAGVSRADRVAPPLTRHIVLVGFMGAGKTTLAGARGRADRIRRPRPRRDARARARRHRRVLPRPRRGGVPRASRRRRRCGRCSKRRRACSPSAAAPSRLSPSARG